MIRINLKHLSVQELFQQFEDKIDLKELFYESFFDDGFGPTLVFKTPNKENLKFLPVKS